MSDLLCACIMCAKRADCMPGYDDETLNYGAREGHAPQKPDECPHHLPGDDASREKALAEREEFNEYAKNLIKSYGV